MRTRTHTRARTATGSLACVHTHTEEGAKDTHDYARAATQRRMFAYSRSACCARSVQRPAERRGGRADWAPLSSGRQRAVPAALRGNTTRHSKEEKTWHAFGITVIKNTTKREDKLGLLYSPASRGFCTLANRIVARALCHMTLCLLWRAHP